MMRLNNSLKIDPAYDVFVFAEVQPNDGTTSMSICQGDSPEDDFRLFIDGLLAASRQRGVYPDSWIFKYDIPAGSKGIQSVRQCADDFRIFHLFTQREGITATRILPLRDVAFCQEQGLDFLSPEGRHDRLMNDPDYHSFLNSDKIYTGQRTPDKLRTAHAIDIGSGVLLYDFKHPIGREAYKSFMQHCADHFFDREMTGFDKMSLYEVQCFFDQETIVRKLGALNFNPLYFGRNFRLNHLSTDSLYDHALCLEGLFIKEYDMQPTATAFVEFLAGEGVRASVHTNSLNIAVLDQIAREGFPLQPSSELRSFSPFLARFKDLEDQIKNCENTENMLSLQRLAKLRAQEILNEEFPQRRTMDSSLQQTMPEINNKMSRMRPRL